jgi:hypothetical protein
MEQRRRRAGHLAQVGLDPTKREDDAAPAREEDRATAEIQVTEARMLTRLEQAEILRQVKNLLAGQRRNRTSVLSSRMTEESEKQSNAKALENFADFLKEF